MHSEGIIYSRQHYSLTPLILRAVYCQFCKARLAHTQSKGVWRRFAFDLWPLDHSAKLPWTKCSYACSLACNKGDYSWVCRV